MLVFRSKQQQPSKAGQRKLLDGSNVTFSQCFTVQTEMLLSAHGRFLRLKLTTVVAAVSAVQEINFSQPQFFCDT